MSVMDVAVWEVKSKRGVYNKMTPRPALLAAIDLALAAYHQTKSLALLQALRTAVDACALNPPIVTGVRAYGTAVTDLKKTVDAQPGMAGPLIQEWSKAGAAANAAAAALVLTNSTANNVHVKAPVTQRCDGNVAAWDVFWKLSLSAPNAFDKPSGTLGILTVTVPIAPQAPGAGMVAITDATKKLWMAHISTVWNGAKFMVRNNRLLEVVFDIEWCAPGTAFAFPLSAAPTPPLAPPANWKAKAAANVANTASGVYPEQVGGNVGTPHLYQWGDKDICAVSHEFGHMLGLPDEYDTDQYMGQGVPADTYNKRAFTTDSLMNNTGENGRLHKWHYHLIRRSLEQWKGLPANTTLTILKGSTY